MRYVLYIAAMLMCLYGKAQNSYTLTGRVVDEKQAPLPGATVFLTGTKSIAASDGGGNFNLSVLKAGEYKLIVKMVGYKPLVKDVAIREQGMKLSLQLEPDVKSLRSVTVRPDKSWLDHMETFKQQFLGESENALHCKLVNSGILTFDYDRKAEKLTAVADDILIIKNQELGYQLKYVLLNFEYDEKKNSVVFMGYPSFEELKGTPEEEAQWKTNRRMAYLGSIHHFVRCIYEQNCKAEGFVVYKIRNRAPFGFPDANKRPVKVDYDQVSFDSLLTVSDDHHKVLSFKDALYVVYAKQKEQQIYKEKGYSLAGMYITRRVPEGEVSIVNLFGPVTIDDTGAFQPTSSLYFEGYMGWKKIADLVPYEYDPVE